MQRGADGEHRGEDQQDAGSAVAVAEVLAEEVGDTGGAEERREIDQFPVADLSLHAYELDQVVLRGLGSRITPA